MRQIDTGILPEELAEGDDVRAAEAAQEAGAIAHAILPFAAPDRNHERGGLGVACRRLFRRDYRNAVDLSAPKCGVVVGESERLDADLAKSAECFAADAAGAE
jgi:hypothetical protein